MDWRLLLLTTALTLLACWTWLRPSNLFLSSSLPFPLFPSWSSTTPPPTPLPPLPPRCPIYTYFQPVTLGFPSNNLPLETEKVQAWRAHYFSKGWRPVVLDQAKAMRVANASAYEVAFRALPSVNPAEYEVNCYLRWMALVDAGGGLFLDYDIMDMSSVLGEGLQGGEWTDAQLNGSCEYGQLTTYENLRPMVSHGSAQEVLRWVEYMAAYQLTPQDMYDGRPHMSDMIMAINSIDRGVGVFAGRPRIPWMHFSHSFMMTARPYAANLHFMARMLQLHFLFNHRLVTPLDATHSTELLVRSIALCNGDQFGEVGEGFCDVNYAATSEPEQSRAAMCRLVAPSPWKLSQVACQHERSTDSLLLPPPRVRLQHRLAEQRSKQMPSFVIAVIPHPVARAYQELCMRDPVALSSFLSSSSSISSVDDGEKVTALSAVLQSSLASPFLLELTQHLAADSSAEQRWAAAVAWLFDSRSALLLAEEDIPIDALSMQKTLAPALGFTVSSHTVVEHQQLLARLPTRFTCTNPNSSSSSSYLNLSSSSSPLLSAIEARHALDVAFYRLARERWAQRQKEWESLS